MEEKDQYLRNPSSLFFSVTPACELNVPKLHRGKWKKKTQTCKTPSSLIFSVTRTCQWVRIYFGIFFRFVLGFFFVFRPGQQMTKSKNVAGGLTGSKQ